MLNSWNQHSLMTCASFCSPTFKVGNYKNQDKILGYKNNPFSLSLKRMGQGDLRVTNVKKIYLNLLNIQKFFPISHLSSFNYFYYDKIRNSSNT